MLNKTRLISIIIALSFSFCTRDIVRINNDQAYNKNSKIGVIGFGVFLSKTSNLDSPLSDSNVNSLFNSLNNILFAKISSVNEKDKIVQVKLFVTEDPIYQETQESIKYFYSNVSSDVNQEYPGLYFALAVEEPNNTYLIHRITFYFNCGENKFCSKVINIPPWEAYKSMPLNNKSGDITFLGNYGIKMSEDSSFLGFNGTDTQIKIDRANDFLIKSKDDYIKKSFFGDESISEVGLHLNFFKHFSKTQKSGYWKNISDDKIKKLTESKAQN